MKLRSPDCVSHAGAVANETVPVIVPQLCTAAAAAAGTTVRGVTTAAATATEALPGVTPAATKDTDTSIETAAIEINFENTRIATQKADDGQPPDRTRSQHEGNSHRYLKASASRPLCAPRK